MFPSYFLILWATCYVNCASSNKSYEGANISELFATTNWSIESNENVVNEEISSRERVTESLDHFKDRTHTDGFSTRDLQPILSFSNFESNFTEALLLPMQMGDKELKIQTVKDYLLIVTWSNRTSNHTASRRTRELGSFRHVPVDMNWIIKYRGSSPWKGMYDTYGPKLVVSFDELGLADIVVAPPNFMWPICREVSDVIPEILKKLGGPSYPVPVVVAARFQFETRFGVAGSEKSSGCVPSGWRSMVIVYISGNRVIHTRLPGFLPTACACRE